MSQVKEPEKAPEKNSNEMEVGNLPNKEFKETNKKIHRK